MHNTKNISIGAAVKKKHGLLGLNISLSVEIIKLQWRGGIATYVTNSVE